MNPNRTRGILIAALATAEIAGGAWHADEQDPYIQAFEAEQAELQQQNSRLLTDFQKHQERVAMDTYFDSKDYDKAVAQRDLQDAAGEIAHHEARLEPSA